MVKLDNPYAQYRPSWKVFIPMLLLYPLLKWVLHYSFFSLLYQYSIALLLLIIISQYLDERLLTKDRIFSFDFPFEKKIFYLIVMVITLIPIRNIAVHFTQVPQLLNFYQGNVTSLESLLVLIAIISPCEELFFRGFVQYNLSFFLGKYGGIVASALLYSIIGIAAHSLYLALLLFTIGTIIGFIYSRVQSLVQATLLHVITIIFMYIFPF
ncbi:MAG: CPBP family intramembrane metalloprotease [Spirochaetes bacterium]|nr:CPBP family intramembrane metalloprotease [Spirochaetota bacterium]